METLNNNKNNITCLKLVRPVENHSSNLIKCRPGQKILHMSKLFIYD